jgi:hypothetical protein
MVNVPNRKAIVSIGGAWVFFVGLVLLNGWGCSGSDSGGESGTPDIAVGTTREVRQTSQKDSLLSIGREPIQEFPYDARGPGTPGTITYQGHGKAKLVFLAEDMEVVNMQFIPGVPIGVEIIPQDEIGTIDFCTGDVRYSFDSLFQPFFFRFPSGADVRGDRTHHGHFFRPFSGGDRPPAGREGGPQAGERCRGA